MLDWLNYKETNSDFINSSSLYAIYQSGYPIKLAVFRTGKGMVNIDGSFQLWNIEKIALVNIPENK